MYRNAFLTIAALLAVLAAAPASSQIPGPAGVVVNQTPVQGGTSTNCLYVNGAVVGQYACGSGAASGITVGTSAIASGTTTRVLFDNAGVLGEYTPTQLTAQINAATASLSGALPAWPNNTTTFFRGDGTYTALNLAAFPTQATNTVLGNGTSGTAVPTALAVGSCSTAASALTWTTNAGFGCNTSITAGKGDAPTIQVFTTGTNATYTTPANTVAIQIEMVGGGGGGAGSGTTPGAATAGTATCWKTSSPACTTPDVTGNGGGLGTTNGTACGGGTATGGDVNLSGGAGGYSAGTNNFGGGYGGNSFFGGAGPGGVPSTAGIGAQANTGSGGGGGATTATNNTGGGGCAGGYSRKLIASPAASYFYTIGSAGGAGTAGTGGVAGGAGAAGLMIVTEFH